MYHAAWLSTREFPIWARPSLHLRCGQLERGSTEMAHSGGDLRLAVLGAGKMGGILIEAFLKQGLVSPKNISATVQHAAQERKSIGGGAITLGTDNRAAVRNADVILLCVKPQT